MTDDKKLKPDRLGCYGCGKFMSKNDFSEEDINFYQGGKGFLECFTCWNGDTYDR